MHGAWARGTVGAHAHDSVSCMGTRWGHRVLCQYKPYPIDNASLLEPRAWLSHRLAANKPQQSPCLIPPSFGLQMSQWPYLAFYVNSGDWNSGHHPCPASFYPLNYSVALILYFKLSIICYRIPTDKTVTSIQGNWYTHLKWLNLLVYHKSQ